jgi:GNAT superfamily N-acetyltransferase
MTTTGLRTVGLRADLLAAAVRVCAASLTRTAARIDKPWLRPPDAPTELAQAMLRRYLDAEVDGRYGWVVLDHHADPTQAVRAVAGLTILELSPDDPRYTYMPPRSATVTATACHTDSDPASSDPASGSAATACYPLLLDAFRRVAAEHAIPKLLVGTAPADPAAKVWHDLGLRPEVSMASQPVAAWQPIGTAPPGITIRPATLDDVEALTDLALEEHHYHAHHTAAGTSPDQPRQTSRRLAAEGLAAAGADGTTCQLLAERLDPRGGPAASIGSIVGSITNLGDDQPARYLLPPRHGYIGLTSVTAAARGAGVGGALVDALMKWFATQAVELAFLHYVTTNPLSKPFWTRLGFTTHSQTLATPLP